MSDGKHLSTPQDRQKAAFARLAVELAKPHEDDAAPRADGALYSDDWFDPWSMFPSLYGTYGSDFDACAINVLEELLSGNTNRSDLGAEMFREMLCVMELCEYGTSPRACFWLSYHDEDMAMLRRLIERWKEYSVNHWGSEVWHLD